MRPVTFLVAILAVAPLTRVTAQEPPPVKVGAQVRVTAPHVDIVRYIGTLARIDADTETQLDAARMPRHVAVLFFTRWVDGSTPPTATASQESISLHLGSAQSSTDAAL